jgi:ComF family protein
MKELGYAAGARFGQALAESVLFNSIDLIVPVPLHPSKEKQRGYNQSEWIAKGLAFSMQKQISTGNLIRKVHTSTQTKKNRFERWENVENIFAVENAEEFRGKHILLSDDVITTGSTLEACAAELLKIESVKVSTATLAFADY